MKLRTLAVCPLFAGVSSAREHDYQHGTLLRMDSCSCGSQEKGSKTVAGEIFATDSQHKQTKELLVRNTFFKPTMWSVELAQRTINIRPVPHQQGQAHPPRPGDERQGIQLHCRLHDPAQTRPRCGNGTKDLPAQSTSKN
jgi:hypothetical protein